MPDPIVFFATGRPRTKGSTRSFLYQGRIVTQGANPKTRAWQGVIAHAAANASVRRLQGGVELGLLFFFARPKGHYGTGKNAGVLKATAPKLPTSRSCGDLDKLVRAVLDALTGVAFTDDSEVTGFGRVAKTYLDDPTAVEGVAITVQPADPAAPQPALEAQGVAQEDLPF